MSNRKLNINWQDAEQVRAYRTEWMRNSRRMQPPRYETRTVRWRDICRKFLPLLEKHPRAAYMRKFRRRKRGAK